MKMASAASSKPLFYCKEKTYFTGNFFHATKKLQRGKDVRKIASCSFFIIVLSLNIQKQHSMF